MLARQLRDTPGRQGRGIGERLVEHGSKPVDLREVIGADAVLMMLGAVLRGDPPGILRLIQRLHIKADRCLLYTSDAADE